MEIEINDRIVDDADELNYDPYMRLAISLEEGEGLEIVPCLLFVPNTKEFEHYHIFLTEKGTRDLYNWLGNYLEELKEEI